MDLVSTQAGSLAGHHVLPICLLLLAIVLPAASADQTNDVRNPTTIVAAHFENADVTRRAHYLTEVQRAEAYALTGDKRLRSVVYAYDISRDGKIVGTAYFDKHPVRTLPQTLMTVVTPEHRIERVEVITFTEPLEYKPPSRWYATFKHAGLSPKKKLSPGIHGVTGATLTHHATTRAAKRALALQRVLHDSAAALALWKH